MISWDKIIEIQQRMSEDFPSGEGGLHAINSLREFFEKYGGDKLPNDHPLYHKFFAGTEFLYQWFIQYAKKLNIANSIPGFSEIAPRLSNSKEFLSANNEMEVALKFHLADLNTTFIPTDSNKQTPDILLKIKDNEYNVEVSSLNPSDQETLMYTFYPQLTQLTIGKGLVIGGFINKIPNHNVLAKILLRVKEKIDEIQVTNEADSINEPKYATIYIAPREKKEEIPEGCRGMFRFAHPYRRTIEEKIENKIKDKYNQLFSSDNPSFLYLYSQILEKNELHNFYNNEVDNMEVILPAYRKLIGMALTVPHLKFEVISSMTSSLTLEKSDKKIYLESEIGKGQYESSLIWKNLHSNFIFPTEIGAAIENYSSNLKKLLDIS